MSKNTLNLKQDESQLVIGYISNISSPLLIGHYSTKKVLPRSKRKSVILPFSRKRGSKIVKLERKIALLEKKIDGITSSRYFQISHANQRKVISTYRLTSPFEEKYYNVIFKRNKYISSVKDLWKLIYILNDEEIFENLLVDFNNVIDKDFIDNLFSKSEDVFFIDKFSQKILTQNASNQSHYQTISLVDLLGYLDINEIEYLIEKGTVRYD